MPIVIDYSVFNEINSLIHNELYLHYSVTETYSPSAIWFSNMAFHASNMCIETNILDVIFFSPFDAVFESKSINII